MLIRGLNVFFPPSLFPLAGAPSQPGIAGVAVVEGRPCPPCATDLSGVAGWMCVSTTAAPGVSTPVGLKASRLYTLGCQCNTHTVYSCHCLTYLHHTHIWPASLMSQWYVALGFLFSQ